MFHNAVLDEILEERVVSSRHRWNPRGIKRKMSNYPLRLSQAKGTTIISIPKSIRILK
jgi:hypothetical protein